MGEKILPPRYLGGYGACDDSHLRSHRRIRNLWYRGEAFTPLQSKHATTLRRLWPASHADAEAG